MSEISVVVPVYNVEKYLGQCLDSLINQTFSDIEIICVNDGSTDKSPQILEEYAERDERIRIITQSNQGLGAARNSGLAEAGGKYVYFIDSDDYIDLKTLEKLHDNINSNGSDIVLFKFQSFDDAENIHTRGIEFKIDEIFGDIDYSSFTFTYEDVRKHVMNTAFSACLKLYRKEFLDSYGDFQFPQGLYFEDIPFHVKAMLRASRISFVNEALYYYRSNPDSILNSSAKDFDIFEIIDIVEGFLKENDYFDDFENEFIFFKIAQILAYKISRQPPEYFNRAREEFLKMSIKDEGSIKKYAINGYNRVINSQTHADYLIDFYENKIKRLKKKNRKLSKENEEFKRINEELASKTGGKVSKPIRYLKNLKK
jgi:glycosyltransferase involved in cell wall biosynthesis